jgi:translation elongation factor EF-G
VIITAVYREMIFAVNDLLKSLYLFFLGPLTGSKISGVRFRIIDGDNHCVDSTEIAFQLCTEYAMRQREFSEKVHVF